MSVDGSINVQCSLQRFFGFFGAGFAGTREMGSISNFIITAKGSVRQLNILLALNEITQ
jgi:hypothetical protein